jgi:proline iminopeptidase
VLGVDRFILFGGSWGATLALVYAITHPDHVRHLVLRGVFLMTKAELDWFYGGGAARFFPDLWARFVAPIPEGERGDLIGAYHKRLFSGHVLEETKAARVWSAWENALASVEGEGFGGESPADYARAFARLECHYFQNAGFLPEDGWILKNRGKIAHLPVTVVQGRYDMICPPESAWALTRGWAGAELRLVGMAGHALSEAGISAELVGVMDRLRGVK